MTIFGNENLKIALNEFYDGIVNNNDEKCRAALNAVKAQMDIIYPESKRPVELSVEHLEEAKRFLNWTKNQLYRTYLEGIILNIDDKEKMKQYSQQVIDNIDKQKIHIVGNQAYLKNFCRRILAL